MTSVRPTSVATRDLLTIGEVARRSGAAASAVRFYERRGLIVSERTPGNQRRYPAWTPCVVQVARVAQRAGLSVNDVAELLSTIPDEPSPQDWALMTDRLIEDAERRIAELRAVVAELRSETQLCELANGRGV